MPLKGKKKYISPSSPTSPMSSTKRLLIEGEEPEDAETSNAVQNKFQKYLAQKTQYLSNFIVKKPTKKNKLSFSFGNSYERILNPTKKVANWN